MREEHTALVRGGVVGPGEEPAEEEEGEEEEEASEEARFCRGERRYARQLDRAVKLYEGP